jgi:uncharacterized repeat protein (TIGR01451 family)
MKVYPLGALLLIITGTITPTSQLDAAVAYQYTGNTYTFFPVGGLSVYNGSMSINGSFIVDSKLINVNGDITSQVISYSYSDGISTYSDEDPEGLAQFSVVTDSQGNITNWTINIVDVDPASPSLEPPGDTTSRIISRNDNIAVIDEAFIRVCDSKVNLCTFSTIGRASSNNPGSWSTPQVDIADLSIDNQAPPVVVVDRQYEYIVRIDNLGSSSALNAVATELLPAGVSLVSATRSQGTCTGTSTVTCPLGIIDPSDFSLITIIVTAPSVPGSFTHTATVTDAGTSDPDLTNNTDSNTVDVVPLSASADRNITMQDSPDPVPVLEEVVYTITATNNGPADLPSGIIRFHAPSLNMLEFNSASGLSCTTAPCGIFPLCVNVAVRVTCTTPFMIAGSTVQASISVDAAGPTPILTTASFGTSSGVPDPDSSNNVTDQSTEIVPKVIASSGGGGGCTLGTRANYDPTLLIILMLLLLVHCKHLRCS